MVCSSITEAEIMLCCSSGKMFDCCGRFLKEFLSLSFCIYSTNLDNQHKQERWIRHAAEPLSWDVISTHS